MKKDDKKIIVILGPTASGKSNLAVELARKFRGEVISADSRQVYKGMDIGTGKITKREMKGVPHHLLDVANPKKVFTVVDFKKKAEKALEDIWSRGKLPIVCGGTGFYIQAITGGIAIPEVKPDWKLRKELEKKTAEQLFEMLKKLDSKRAKTIDAKNPRRLIRAIEIATALGSVPKLSLENEPPNDAILFIGVKLPGKELKKKIEKRMKQMLRRGLVKETEKLKKSGLSWKRINELGFEYKYPAMYLLGEIGKEELLEKLVQSNLKYAKTQMTWFKKYTPKTKWVKTAVEAEKIVKKFP